MTNKTLLAIDDDSAILTLLTMVLEPLVSQMWTSIDPQDGLRLAMMHKPSVILLDNHMEPMMGIEVLQQLRKMPNTANIPVFMMTADSSLETVRAAHSHKVQGYLLKPCDPDTLIETLAPWLDLPYRKHQWQAKLPLKLSEAQIQTLEIYSLTRLLDLIKHELSILNQEPAGSHLLSLCLERLEIIQESLNLEDYEILQRLETLEPLLQRQVNAYLKQCPATAQLLPGTRLEANIKTLSQHLQQRATLFLRRQKESWAYLEDKALKELLFCPIEAMGFNQLNNYHVDYGHYDFWVKQYKLIIDISSQGFLNVPMILPELAQALLANAFVHSEEDQVIELQIRETAKALILTVIDQGTGIDSDRLSQLIQYGFQETPLNAPYISGLGLSRVWQATHALGGKLSIATDLGVGTRVSLEIPLVS